MEIIVLIYGCNKTVRITKEEMAKHARGKARKNRKWGKNVGDPNSKKGNK